ncbi:MAG: hypothetical protein EOP67_30295, partial [Sphingomonas sp.]
MHLTLIGAVQLVIGFLLLMFGTVPGMLAFVLVSALMMGSSAIDLPAIGASSIPPIEFAAVFLTIRVLLPGSINVPAQRGGERDEADQRDEPRVAVKIAKGYREQGQT